MKHYIVMSSACEDKSKLIVFPLLQRHFNLLFQSAVYVLLRHKVMARVTSFYLSIFPDIRLYLLS